MKVIKDYLKVKGTDPYRRKRPAFQMDYTTITIHNTANPKSNAEDERAWLDNPSNKRIASYHYVICGETIIQAIPDNENAWHAGDDVGNMTSLGIEVCESGDFDLSIKTTAKFVAKKLKEKGLSSKAVVPHKYWSGKNCPRLILEFWDEFVGMIKKELKEDVNGSNIKYPWSVDALNWARYNKISDCTRLDDAPTRRELIVIVHNAINYLIDEIKDVGGN